MFANSSAVITCIHYFMCFKTIVLIIYIVSFISVSTYLHVPTNQYGFAAKQINAIYIRGCKTKSRNAAIQVTF